MAQIDNSTKVLNFLCHVTKLQKGLLSPVIGDITYKIEHFVQMNKDLIEQYKKEDMEDGVGDEFYTKVSELETSVFSLIYTSQEDFENILGSTEFDAIITEW